MKKYLFLTLAFVSSSTLLTAGCSDRAKKSADPVVGSSATSPTSPSPATVATVTPVPSPVATRPEPAAIETPPVAVTANADPYADIAVALGGVTRDTMSSLSPMLDTTNKIVDGQIEAWKAAGGKSTPMADDKLAQARADFGQKIRDLSLQGEETWRNAKSTAQDTLQNLRRVYGEYLAGTPKN